MPIHKVVTAFGHQMSFGMLIMNGQMVIKSAYMLYYSASSTWRRSAIGLAVAKTIEGPYSYADTVIYSGFTEKDSTDGSERNTNYQNTRLAKLIKERKSEVSAKTGRSKMV
ncbi:hypothetical protein MOP89_12370 [Enterococcus gallinarum]|nr:hypothetical protein [Enterococcus gallinarum]